MNNLTLKERLALVMKEKAQAQAQEKEEVIKEGKEKEEKEKEEVTPSQNLAERMRAILAASKTSSSSSTSKSPVVTVSINSTGEVELTENTEKEGLLGKSDISYSMLNERQRLAVSLASSGSSFVLIGSAGSGKTTTQRMILQKLLAEGKLGTLPKDLGSKYLAGGSPSVLITSFTKVATRNIKEAAPLEFKSNCVNIHKAIEFAPTQVLIESVDSDGMPTQIESMRFTPQKNRFDPLKGIKLCIIEEAGSLDVGLFLQLADALPKNCTYIFLGDLNQLPPVYGAAILGFAINKLPVVELTEVYRQGIGPIKELASLILEGKKIAPKTLTTLTESSREGATLDMNFFSSKKKNRLEEGFRLNKGLGDFMRKEALEGRFKEGKSVVLTPVRKQTQEFLTIFEINKHIAQALGEVRGAEVHEVRSRSISGGLHYYAIGDLVFHDREYYRISKIEVNPSYVSTFGMDFKPSNTTMDRWGRTVESSMFELSSAEDKSLDELLDGEIGDFLALGDDAKESKNLISHKLTLEQWEVEEDELPRTLTIESPGELDTLTLGYAQTIHSSQGSEWEDVYLLCPDNIGFMLNREMLYTGVTRARSRLVVWAEDGTKPYNALKGTFDAGIKHQAIKGDTLKDKRKFFKELGESKSEYKPYPKLLEELNLNKTLSIENYFKLDDNNSLELKGF